MKIIVTGATGTAGSEVIRQAILDEEISQVTALVRTPLAVRHSKLQSIIHTDFLNYTLVKDQFKNYDACIWCLGISQNRVNKEEYVRITYDYTIEAARAMLEANPTIGFIFLSGGGADSNEQARMLFARIKGKTENKLNTMGFKRLHHFRPNYIHSTFPGRQRKIEEKLLDPFAPFVYLIMPNIIINVEVLAKAMIKAAKYGTHKLILENNDIKNLVQQ